MYTEKTEKRYNGKARNVYSWVSLLPKEIRHLAYKNLKQANANPFLNQFSLQDAINCGFSWNGLYNHGAYWNDIFSALACPLRRTNYEQRNKDFIAIINKESL